MNQSATLPNVFGVSSSPTSSAQRVGFFNIGSGRSVEIYDRVFSGIFFTLGYFWVFLGIPGYFWVNWISSLFFGGSEPNIKALTFIEGCKDCKNSQIICKTESDRVGYRKNTG